MKGMAVSASGNVYVTGYTSQKDFPVTKSAYQSTMKNDVVTGFVTELNSSLSALVFSTFLGGTVYDTPAGVALDSSGDIYVAGITISADFPVTSGAYQTKFKALSSSFVTKLSPAGSSLIYSTFLGGTNEDVANGIAVDSSNSAYVTGSAYSTDFPVTSGAFQTTSRATARHPNTFVTKFNSAGSGLVYSTLLGGTAPASSDPDFASGIAILPKGTNAFVTGTTYAPGFPVSPGAYQSTLKSNQGNAYVTELNAAGSGIVYSTYLGGSGCGDAAGGITVDASANVYTAGYSCSTDFPTSTGAFQTKNKAAASSGSNGYVSEFAFPTIGTTTSLSASVATAQTGASVTFTATVTATSGTATGNVVFTVDGATGATAALSTAGKATYATTKLAAGTHTVVAIYTGTSKIGPSASAALTETITLPSAAAPTCKPAAGAYKAAQSVTLADTPTGAVIYYSTDGSTPSAAEGTKYTTAITVSQTETINAVAVATGYNTSSMASAAYTILLPQTITFAPLAGAPYGARPITLSATASSGLAVTYKVISGPGSISGSTLTVTGAGSIVIAADQAGNSVNNAATEVKQTLAVTKAALTVTANNLSMIKGATVPTLTFATTGFVNSDTQVKAVTGAPKLTTTGTKTSLAGTYPITATTGTLAATNYTFTYANGTLTITAN